MILSGWEIAGHISKEIMYDVYTSGKYQNNTGIQPSLLYRDIEK